VSAEREALRKDADIVRRARARSSVVVEVTPELLTKDAFTAQPLHVMLTDNGDGTHLLTFRESEELHTLRKDAARLRDELIGCKFQRDHHEKDAIKLLKVRGVNRKAKLDTARLDWLADTVAIEAFGIDDVDADAGCEGMDIYEHASHVAYERGNDDDPTPNDRREGFRRMIDAAMEATP
jgi:hypothetical protein